MPIHYEVDDHVATITIDRPETRNALDMYHFRDLAAAWRRFKDDDDVWVAIITGVGDAFMAGAALKTLFPPGPGRGPEDVHPPVHRAAEADRGRRRQRGRWLPPLRQRVRRAPEREDLQADH